MKLDFIVFDKFYVPEIRSPLSNSRKSLFTTIHHKTLAIWKWFKYVKPEIYKVVIFLFADTPLIKFL